MALFSIYNGASPTTAAQVSVDTSTSILTLLQIKSTRLVKFVEWGISFDGFVAALPIRVELFATSVTSTGLTEHVAADIINLDPHAEAVTDDNPFDLSTDGTGFTATGEGTPANVRMLDVQFVAPTNQYIKQWPLGREPEFDPDEFIRVRVTAGGAVNAYCYVVIEV